LENEIPLKEKTRKLQGEDDEPNAEQDKLVAGAAIEKWDNQKNDRKE